MVQINLLPWREQKRKQKKIHFAMTFAVALGITLIINFLLHTYFVSRVNFQKKRNEFLQAELGKEQKELRELNQKKKEEVALENKVQFIISLRTKSLKAVSLLDTIAKTIPPTISLDKISREGNMINIIGKAQSNLEITQFMKNIANSTGFKQPTLTEISSEKNANNLERTFQIRIEQLN